MEENERSDGFKVSDKRRFTAEGENKAGEPAGEQAAKPLEEPREPEPAPEPEAVDKEAEERASAEELPPLTFAGFVIGLANSALFQLGLIPVSQEGQPKKDLQAARQTIDIIALLEEKTRGNLTDEEKRIITETLFQLRMAFVEASK